MAKPKAHLRIHVGSDSGWAACGRRSARLLSLEEMAQCCRNPAVAIAEWRSKELHGGLFDPPIFFVTVWT